MRLQALALLLLIVFSNYLSVAQNAKVDSLRAAVNSSKADTNRVKLLLDLSKELIASGDHDKGLAAAQQGAELALSLMFTTGAAMSYSQAGKAYFYKGKYQDAITAYTKGYNICTETGDKKGIASALNNIGLIYDNLGDHPNALENYFKALKYMEESGSKKVIAAVYNNIGNIYRAQGENEKALDYHQRSLKLKEEINDKKGIASSLNNIGNVYSDSKSYKQALEYQEKALAIREEIGDKMGMSTVLTNIGNVYTLLGEYSKAEENYFKGLKILEEMNDKYTLSISLFHIGSFFIEQKEPVKALDYLKRSLSIAATIKALDRVQKAHEKMSLAYEQSGQPLPALQHYRKFIAIRDSLYNEENTKKMLRTEMNFEYEKKEQAARLEQEKEQALAKAALEKQQLLLAKNEQELLILEQENELKGWEISESQWLLKQKRAQAENQKKAIALLNKDKKLKEVEAKQKEETLQRQRTITWSFGVGGSAMLVLALLVFRGYRQKKKANEIISTQKAMLEEKNREVLDSIHYAKRIQLALLKEEEHVSGNLPSHFVFFRPKDIVSGDFYWSLQKKDAWLVAAADCTGHGVPGAMMSMLGMSFLNEITNTEEVPGPSMILDRLRDKIIYELGETGEETGGSMKDGMDISLCMLTALPHLPGDKKNYRLHWSGANNPLWIIRSNTLEEIDPDKQPIGYHPSMRPFTTHSIELQQGDCFYIFTDGFADQFGGEKGKKFKTSNFKKLLLSIHHETMDRQKELAEHTFDSWKRDFEQVDDVCVIGVRL
jgi:tetratricopeptide (TPR) repeat protein